MSILSHGHRFVPTTGDWEGTVHGFPMSFELVKEPGSEPAYGFDNVVMFTPSTCPADTGNFVEETVDDSVVQPVNRGGSFGISRYGIFGGLTGARSSQLVTKFTYPAGTNGLKCPSRYVWHLRPSRRRAVQDGRWRLHFSDGETQTVGVHAGGRIVTGIRYPKALGSCESLWTSIVSSQLLLFVNPTGSASFTDPGVGLQVTLRFTRRAAVGQMSDIPPGASVPPCRVGITASVLKPSA